MKTTRRPADVAFRLMNELEGLLDGIRADGVIDADEVDRVERWLAENEPFADVRPFSEVATKLRAGLADHVLTIDECEDLLFVCRKFTPFNPYFDQIRSGVQLLMGTLAGIAADGVVRPVELDHLTQWLDDWAHLKGMWPFDECEAVVTEILLRRQLNDEARELLALASSFPVAGTMTDPAHPMIIGDLCAVDPNVVFPEKAFVFTGDSPKASRDELAAQVIKRGGLHHKNVRLDSNYLIVCHGGSPYWAFSCYGRKVEKALEYRREGVPLVIVEERDFWDAIA